MAMPHVMSGAKKKAKAITMTTFPPVLDRIHSVTVDQVLKMLSQRNFGYIAVQKGFGIAPDWFGICLLFGFNLKFGSGSSGPGPRLGSGMTGAAEGAPASILVCL
jgi:hypothetical protein